MNDEFVRLLFNPTFLLMAAWLVKEVFAGYKRNSVHYEQSLTIIREQNQEALRKINDKMSVLNLAIVRLDTRMEHMLPQASRPKNKQPNQSLLLDTGSNDQ
jgi:hypothetical protein